MAAKPKKRNGEAQPVNAMLDALKFVSYATKEIGAPFETHVILGNQWAIATNGVVSIGHQIIEEIQACPHTFRLIDALASCAEAYSITQLDAGRLAVRSGKFRAVVPCIEPALAQLPFPDPPVAAIDDRLRAALETVGVLAAEGAQHVLTASVLLRAGSALATNRHVIFEAWHGIDLPPGLVVPKAAIVALSKVAKPLARFGYSQTSATFYFDDGSWLKTQLYNEQWPASVDRILNGQVNAWPVPVDFWKAVDAIEPFSDEGKIFFNGKELRTHPDEGTGASYEVSGIPTGVCFNEAYLKLIKPLAKQIDFCVKRDVDKNGYMLVFFGDNVRGCIAGMRTGD